MFRDSREKSNKFLVLHTTWKEERDFRTCCRLLGKLLRSNLKKNWEVHFEIMEAKVTPGRTHTFTRSRASLNVNLPFLSRTGTDRIAFTMQSVGRCN